MLAQGVDPIAFGRSRQLLELNQMVLCGPSPDRRAEHAAHAAATEARFYADREAGADAFYAWLEAVPAWPAPTFAARLYVRIVSSPQLFIEGNQRTATLCASSVLARAGMPPLVVEESLVAAFAPVAAACRAVDRSRSFGLVRGWIASCRLRQFILRKGSGRFLVPPTAPPPVAG